MMSCQNAELGAMVMYVLHWRLFYEGRERSKIYSFPISLLVPAFLLQQYAACEYTLIARLPASLSVTHVSSSMRHTVIWLPRLGAEFTLGKNDSE
jgi:hypothetical protein